MFDNTGTFLHRLILPSRLHTAESRTPARPYGLCVIGNTGTLAVCDRDAHRIVLMAYDGSVVGDLLTSTDGLRYPFDVDVSVADDGRKLVAVIESYSGLLGNEPHHAVKLFAV